LLGLTAGLETCLGSPELVASELALIEVTIGSLLAAPVDFERMVAGWVGRLRSGPVHPDTKEPLAWLDRHHLPPGAADVAPSAAALIRFLPAVVLTAGSPANLVSGSYHLTALWSGDPETQWAAVAANIAAAQFLRGRKDFVADAIEALRANDAPPPVLAALRRIPFEPEADLDRLDPAKPVDCMHLALWFAHREPRLAVAVSWGARHRASWRAPLMVGVLGARDGAVAVRRALAPSVVLERRADELIQPLLNVRPES
jgi:ADP-ribosylglycohydrolase